MLRLFTKANQPRHQHQVPVAPTRQRLVASLVLLMLPALVQAGPAFERWYTVEMAGQHAGYMHASRTIDDDTVVSISRVLLSIGRGEARVSIEMEGRFVETPQGVPISMTKIERLGAIPSTTEYTFARDELQIRTVQAGQTTETTRPLPGGTWLTPAAAEQYIRNRLEAGADRIVVRTLNPLSGAEVEELTRTGISQVEMNIQGRDFTVYRCNAVSSSMPGINSTEYLDAGGVPVKLTTHFGPMALTMMMSDKEQATAIGGGLAPDMMNPTFIRPDRPIRSPRTTTTASYLLHVADGTMPALPETSVQRVEPLEARSARVLVELDNPRSAEPTSAADPSYLESSSMLNAQDPEIIALVARALAKADEEPAARAEQLRGFVYRYIANKGLDVGFASASEVARSRQGDCTEHAVLLAAMLRADGIPARVVSGLIYADRFAGQRHIFGYHMWTQAIVDRGTGPAWVDLDATLPVRGPGFDATHIAISTSALRDGEAVMSLAALAPLIGQLQISVESIEE
jgi:hypothetical protein